MNPSNVSCFRQKSPLANRRHFQLTTDDDEDDVDLRLESTPRVTLQGHTRQRRHTGGNNNPHDPGLGGHRDDLDNGDNQLRQLIFFFTNQLRQTMNEVIEM